jgi:GNAT superfamily N-acetyltransferase
MLALGSVSARVAVRPATAGDVASLVELRRRSWHQAYRDILPLREIERATGPRSAERLTRAVAGRRRGQRIVVAHDPRAGLMGYAWGGPQLETRLRYRGEVYELYLEPRMQRQGIGSRLLDAAIWNLVELRLNPVLVWVLAQNPARHFYEERGGNLVAYGPIRIGGYTTTRLAYGWAGALPLPTT